MEKFRFSCDLSVNETHVENQNPDGDLVMTSLHVFACQSIHDCRAARFLDEGTKTQYISQLSPDHWMHFTLTFSTIMQASPKWGNVGGL